MPWLEARDPYKIWISEIILQQTRVAQGWSYYLRFIQKFPDVFALHEAEEKEVLKAWEGLGYYTRARNLKKAASVIVQEYKGLFPDKYENILTLPGIGPYTAAAIAGFAFDLPHAVMDGNVIRIVTRLLCLDKPADSTDVKKKVHQYVNEAIVHVKPSVFNQAIMNFGALVCKPQSPDCPSCPFHTFCLAYSEGKVSAVPFKSPKQAKKNRFFHYFILQDKKTDTIAISRRLSQDIWKGLYELPLIERPDDGTIDTSQIQNVLSEWHLQSATVSTDVLTRRQELSHQKITFYFYIIDINQQETNQHVSFEWVNRESAGQLAMPVTLKNVLQDQVFAKRTI